jgi:hypothetical protein
MLYLKHKVETESIVLRTEWDSAVSEVTGCGPTSRIPFSAVIANFFLCYHVQFADASFFGR